MIPDIIHRTDPPSGGILKSDTVLLYGYNLGLDVELECTVINETRSVPVEVSVEVEDNGWEPFTFYGADGPEPASNSTQLIRVRLSSIEPGHQYRLETVYGPPLRFTVEGEIDRTEFPLPSPFKRLWKRIFRR